MQFSAKIHPWFREHDGWWYVTRKVNGERVQQKLVKGHEKEEEAWRKFHALMAGSLKVTEEVTFNELSFLFLAWARENTGAANWYLYFLTSFDKTYDGRVRDLRKSDVDRWLSSHKWSQSTRRQAITAVKRVLNWGYEEGHIDSIPKGVRKLRRPKMARREQLISEKDHKRILKTVDAEFGQFLRALRETGARPGEVRTVTAAMVDVKAGVWVFADHKTVEQTNKPRIVYLTPAVLKITKRLMKKHPTGPLFRNKFGKPFTGNAVRCRMRRLREKLKLNPGTVAYSYRHSFATDGLEKGVPIADVAELLGHTDVRMVTEHYGHLGQRTQHMRSAARRIIARK